MCDSSLGLIRYGEEHCKVFLLLSAILFYPLKEVIVIGIYSFFPFGVVGQMVYAFLAAILFLFFLIPWLYRLKCSRDMFFFGGIVLFGLLEFGFWRPEEINDVYIGLLIKSMVMAFPYYVVARSLKNYGLLERALYYASFAINVSVLMGIQHHIVVNREVYNMSLAYAALPGAIIAFRMLLRRYSFLAILNAGSGLFAIIFCGTRGPMVCYILFCIYEMIFNGKMVEKHTIRKVLAAFVVGGLVGVCVMNGTESANLAVQYGLSGRLFQRIEEGTFFMDTMRGRIRRAAWETVGEYPFLGVGLLEDRWQIYQRGDFSNVQGNLGYSVYYSHLVFLDWLMEYGVFIGMTISLLIMIYIYKIFAMPGGPAKSCIEVFFFSGCIPMLFSSIWHEDRLFYIVLGMTVSMFKDQLAST